MTKHPSSAAVVERLLAADAPPFAVLHRPHAGLRPDVVEVLFGDLTVVEKLADLPEPLTGDLPVLAVVPYRQIRERGFEAFDDGAPLLALRSRERVLLELADLVASLPDGPHSFTDTGYDVADQEYERIVTAVLADEIAEGAGSNFVIHRCLTGRLDEPPALAALGALRRLLTGERRAYWTFVVHTPGSTFVGATPERHVSVDAGVARMNPISGTLRYPAGGYGSQQEHRDAVLAFLADPKERDELSMVVDEELKMMAVVGDHGGRVQGPYLKEMAHLAHTEYVLEGRTSLDVRQVLAATMFAPTVTGSPIRNACRVINRHEQRGRRYYAGVLALIGQDDEGRQSLDAPILIRTAEIGADGSVRVAAGATLVRGSQPACELAETRAKAAGIVAALRVPASASASASASAGRAVAVIAPPSQLADDPQVLGMLADRNRTLARFWLDDQSAQVTGQLQTPSAVDAGLDSAAGAVRSIAVVDAEDDFTGMLAHLLRSLGVTVRVHSWDQLGPDPARSAQLTGADLVVLGPGPGDPRDLTDHRIRTLHQIARARLDGGVPVLGVCLGHQVISHVLGLELGRLPTPDQGRQSAVELFGTPALRVGFYNSYVVRAPAGGVPGLDFSLDTSAGGDPQRVHAVRGRAVTGLQFHPESVLTADGPQIMVTELTRLFAANQSTSPEFLSPRILSSGLG